MNTNKTRCCGTCRWFFQTKGIEGNVTNYSICTFYRKNVQQNDEACGVYIVYYQPVETKQIRKYMAGRYVPYKAINDSGMTADDFIERVKIDIITDFDKTIIQYHYDVTDEPMNMRFKVELTIKTLE